MFTRHQDLLSVPGINKIKKLNFLNKNKSKMIFVITKTKEKRIGCLKKKQIKKKTTCQIVACMWSLDTTSIF